MATIKRETFETIAAGADIEDYRTDYSGRGMYGKQCVGIVGDMADFMDFVTTLAAWYFEDEDEEAEEFWYRINSVQIDNMGRDSIFYWPSIQAED
jgi:hypothetical protein